MSKKYLSDIIREAKDASETAAFLDKLAEAMDQNKALSESMRAATDTLMTAGIIRGAATQLRNHATYMEEAFKGILVEWPPTPAVSEC